ncbi:MAG: alpha/beta hydrolase [Spirochaetaceae bacterium]|nr:alpha/beta hydrolase [Spirochaetaceae bacterium]
MNIIHVSIGNKNAIMTGYIHSYTSFNIQRNTRPAIVICPGGAYEFVSEIEKDPVAIYYFSKGFNVFILDYSVRENASNFTPLLELSEAFVKIRDNAKDFRTDPTRIAVMGFSAGGHLAASLALLYNNPEFIKVSKVTDGYNSPNALILAYPVITTGEYSHQKSIENVTASENNMIKLLSLENRVTSDCPPVFIWATQDDESVPIENSLLLVSSLIIKKISVEFHLFPSGEHGLSMCDADCNKENTSVAQWKKLSINWLSNIFKYTIS